MTLTPKLPEAFLERFSTWWRLEPRCRSNDLSQAAAPLADPLWSIFRQWQVRELAGEDCGSLCAVSLDHSLQSVRGLGTDTGGVRDLTSVPLEVLVEEEPFPFDEDWRARAQLGQRFERTVRGTFSTAFARTIIAALRKPETCGLFPTADQLEEMDQATKRFLSVMIGRVIDGRKLLDAIAAGDLAAPAGISREAWEAVLGTLDAAPAVIRPAADAVTEAWEPSALRYRFELNPGGSATRLAAPDCRNGDIEWHSFSALGDVRGTFTAQERIAPRPTRIRIRGTSPRWWAFEDGALNFGNLDTPTTDIAKILLMEFVLVYGDDWFSVPVPVPAGNLARIDKLEVVTVFGDTIPITPAAVRHSDPLRRWDVFSLNQVGKQRHVGLANVLLVPPLSGQRLESKPLEEVRFVRDEGANLVWGIEKTILNGVGRASDGAAAHAERLERQRDARLRELEQSLAAAELELTAASEIEKPGLEDRVSKLRRTLAAIERAKRGRTPEPSPVPRYILQTQVPETWVPFIPVNEGAGSAPHVRLKRAQMYRSADVAGEPPEPKDATSRLLGFSGDPILALDESAVPRSGLQLQLTAQRTRGADGKTYVWLGRKVLVGRGEGSSGLKFDVLTES